MDIIPARQVFQSTLPHGSDTVSMGRMYLYNISIHAPSRERQKCWHYSKDYYLISIHAPSRERLQDILICVSVVIFQSTLPHGSDCNLLSALLRHLPISIHAPSRERPCLGNRVDIHHNFNPRSLTGATCVCPC